MKKTDVRQLVLSAMVAAIYFVLSYFGNIFGLTYGPVQCRFAEALCVLPFLFPGTIPGLFVGCLLTNLLSTVGPLDIVLGSLATLLAAFWTSKMPNRYLAPLPPVICNGVIVGAMLAWYEVGFGQGFWALFAFNGVSVAVGELLACYILGSILLYALPKVPYLRRMMPRMNPSRESSFD